MLKRSYATEAEVPTERKADYVPKDGRYVLDVEGFDNIDSVLAKNTELVGKVNGHAADVSAKDAEITRLKSDLAGANIVPRGHKAVPNADAELLEKVKAEGVTTAEAFAALKTKHDELTKTEGVRARQDLMRELAKAAGYDPEKAALLLADNPDVPEQLEFRDGQNGKKEAWAKVKGAGDTLEAKPWADVVKGSEKLSALVPSLAANSGGTRVPGSTGGAGSSSQTNPAEAYLKRTYTPKAAAQ